MLNKLCSYSNRCTVPYIDRMILIWLDVFFRFLFILFFVLHLVLKLLTSSSHIELISFTKLVWFIFFVNARWARKWCIFPLWKLPRKSRIPFEETRLCHWREKTPFLNKYIKYNFMWAPKCSLLLTFHHHLVALSDEFAHWKPFVGIRENSHFSQFICNLYE